MEVIIDRCAGLDVHKDSVVACVRAPDGQGGRVQRVRQFSTFTAGLRQLRDWLLAEGVTAVAMEATGVYWKPVWHVLEPALGSRLLLVNAQHVKNLPGRKTDVSDAAWLAQLLECGLLRGSFVPPAEIAQLRDLTRYRKKLIQERTREIQRVQKLLEDAGIKLDSVISDVLGKSGRGMLEALIAGQDDPDRLAELALGRMRPKIPQLRQALEGRFDTGHHGMLLSMHLRHIDELDTMIHELDVAVERLMLPFAAASKRLQTIPGVGPRTAQVILAEIGADMRVFPTAAHLASWAGVCPGNNQSAGKHRSTRTRLSDTPLRVALTEAAWAAARTRRSYLGDQFRHLLYRFGGPRHRHAAKRAAVAVSHSILIIAWHLLANECDYVDLGPDHFTNQRDQRRRQQQLVNQLVKLGYTITPPATAA